MRAAQLAPPRARLLRSVTAYTVGHCLSLSVTVRAVQQLKDSIKAKLVSILLGGEDWQWLKDLIDTFFTGYGIDSFAFNFERDGNGQ